MFGKLDQRLDTEDKLTVIAVIIVFLGFIAGVSVTVVRAADSAEADGYRIDCERENAQYKCSGRPIKEYWTPSDF